MPEFATGFWQSKLRYYSQEDLLSVAREYKKRELPISVIVADFYHWPVTGDWKFTPELWPDPAGMIKELESMDIQISRFSLAHSGASKRELCRIQEKELYHSP